MVVSSSLQFSNQLWIGSNYGCGRRPKCTTGKGQLHFLSSNQLVTDAWDLYLLSRVKGPISPVSSKYKILVCRAVLLPGGGNAFPAVQKAALILKRAYNNFSASPIALQLGPAIGIIAFALWGLGPLVRICRNIILQKSDSNWKKSETRYITASYVEPLMLWLGTMLICRALKPVTLPMEASHAVKQRLLHFVQSLSSVMAFAYCLSSLIQQLQKFFVETGVSNDARNMGFQFAGKAVYTAVWVAAFSLFMELLGFSTQKWLTAGGLGTVLLTLAGREIFTNFLSSMMIHTTRPFVLNEWIQTKIEGYEVSGTVEHVGWWSPTIIRGDDREAVHIPNHKFTVNVVRNLSQKTHWRIKTHLAISHLDVNKINSIVADMRKVIAKNPQVEQQRLHRRVFLENVDPENQALLILVSCFVKTSHFEEYLCVKEAVLLDLLRVISHHRARLATPIRSIQRVYTGSDIMNVPFTHPQDLANRPHLLIDPSYRPGPNDKSRSSTKSEDENGQKDDETMEPTQPDPKMDIKPSPTPSHVGPAARADEKATLTSTPSSTSISVSSQNLASKDPSEGWQETQGNKKTGGAVSATSGPGASDISGAASNKISPAAAEMVKAKTESSLSSTEPNQEEDEKTVVAPVPVRPMLEDNLVLGVALEGSKRTLPIEGMTSSDAESREPASRQNGNGSAPRTTVQDNSDEQKPSSPDGIPSDQREKES